MGRHGDISATSNELSGLVILYSLAIGGCKEVIHRAPTNLPAGRKELPRLNVLTLRTEETTLKFWVKPSSWLNYRQKRGFTSSPHSFTGYHRFTWENCDSTKFKTRTTQYGVWSPRTSPAELGKPVVPFHTDKPGGLSVGRNPAPEVPFTPPFLQKGGVHPWLKPWFSGAVIKPRP